MPTNPAIHPTGQKSWENRHLTFKQPVDGLYDMWNADHDDLIEGYNAMTAAVQDFIHSAIRDKTTVRALGAGWSWTRIAATDGRILNTKGLNQKFNISASSVSPRYTGSPQHLLFAQCGVSVQEINHFLRTKNQCLRTSGASNGQTIAGALSTGTHGAAFDFGAIPEYVVGLHLITGPDRHVWLERASYPVVANSMAERLGAELLRDDELFNAALVSFGSFGFIHGILLETDDIFLLECHRQKRAFDAPMRQLLETLDFNLPVELPYGNERPYHLQALVNPYNLKGGAFINTMYKRPYGREYQAPDISSDGFAPGDDGPAFIGGLGDVVSALVPLTVNTLLKTEYKPFSDVWGIPGEIFNNVTTHGKVLSAAFAVPLEHVNRTTDIMLALNHTEGPFNGVFAYRFVKSSTATLGFTKFEPVSCVMEMDGMYSNGNVRFCKKVWDAMDLERIPFTSHWGKVSDLSPVRLETMYGEKLSAWKAARKRLLDAESLAVFTNPQIVEWGLNG